MDDSKPLVCGLCGRRESQRTNPKENNQKGMWEWYHSITGLDIKMLALAWEHRGRVMQLDPMNPIRGLHSSTLRLNVSTFLLDTLGA